ncbi:hypothetical protein [Tahibacter soli]|jgi:hypothetical protein|uniref:Uncharacterized protein n=1 Tax=Tahibacter soli TaxID=2983605 RepID=A0A9X3YNX8_9GAMM|nr:hypothetical protein [Tahibacter soli]MDC8014780.1 hypothetical protein [Tahibacter soli]
MSKAYRRYPVRRARSVRADAARLFARRDWLAPARRRRMRA